mgnify:CR=1 FL=1
MAVWCSGAFTGVMFVEIFAASTDNKRLPNTLSETYNPNFALILNLFILETADNSSAKPAFLLHLLRFSTTLRRGLMESSMKVLLIILGSLNLLMYWHGLRNRKDVKKVLVQGAVEVEGEKIGFNAIVFQARCFLFLVLAMNQCLWFLCFKYVSTWIGGAGSILCFLDFVFNNEVLSHLKQSVYTEIGANRVIYGFYFLGIPYVFCLTYMMVKIFNN